MKFGDFRSYLHNQKASDFRFDEVLCLLVRQHSTKWEQYATSYIRGEFEESRRPIQHLQHFVEVALQWEESLSNRVFLNIALDMLCLLMWGLHCSGRDSEGEEFLVQWYPETTASNESRLLVLQDVAGVHLPTEPAIPEGRRRHGTGFYGTYCQIPSNWLLWPGLAHPFSEKALECRVRWPDIGEVRAEPDGREPFTYFQEGANFHVSKPGQRCYVEWPRSSTMTTTSRGGTGSFSGVRADNEGVNDTGHEDMYRFFKTFTLLWELEERLRERTAFAQPI